MHAVIEGRRGEHGDQVSVSAGFWLTARVRHTSTTGGNCFPFCRYK